MPLKWGVLETDESRAEKAAEEAAGRRKMRKVVFATTVSTVFVAYDFILFGAMTPLIARKFFTGVNESTAFILALLIFAAGFVVRPLGALLFGSMGDRSGRKKAFMYTITVMGFATVAMGLLPGYNSIGIAAPVLLIILRFMQGLAYGGEHSGAAIYTAEHAPQGKRGLYVGYVQSAAGFALFMSFLVIFLTRNIVGESNFEAWGWRIPFLLSLLLLVFSLRIRLTLDESPVFRKMQGQGKTSKQPLREAFGDSENLKPVLLVLFGLMSLQGVVFYTAHFYSQFFLTRILQLPSGTMTTIMMVVTAASTVLYIFFCWLSDYVGRRNIILLGAMLSIATLWTFFHQLGEAANPALMRAHEYSPVVVIADPEECSVQFDPLGMLEPSSSCDVARRTLASIGIGFSNEEARPGEQAIVQIGSQAFLSSIDLQAYPGDQVETAMAGFEAEVRASLISAGYPEVVNIEEINVPVITGIIFLMVVFSTMVYGPAMVMALESFPARIRYSALSLPWQIGSAWFGGLLPAIAFAVTVFTGDLYSGLLYPMAVIAVSILILTFNLEETRDLRLDELE